MRIQLLIKVKLGHLLYVTTVTVTLYSFISLAFALFVSIFLAF